MTNVATIPTSLDSEASPKAKPLQQVTEQSWARRRVEQWYPWGIAMACAILAAVSDPSSKMLYDALSNSLDATVGAAAILAGFQGTALTLLFTLVGTKPITMLRRRGIFGRLVGYHWQAILAMIIAVVGSVSLLALQGIVSDFDSYSQFIAAGVAFIVVLAALTSFRIVHLMVLVLSQSYSDEPPISDA